MKTILVTGSTDGIGKLAAMKLAQEGHSVYVHGRNQEKLSATILEIKEATKNDLVDGFVADFSNLNSVKHMADQGIEKLPKIDVLINNVGVYNSPVAENKDGLDMRFVVNYFAPVLLTNKLLPLLENGTDSRIINLSSAAQAPVSFDALLGEEKLSAGETYAQSKLAFTMWSFYLAKQVSGISVIAVNPGSLLNTNMVKEAFGRHWSSADKGGDILHDLAVSKEYSGRTGEYFDNDSGDFGKAHPDAYDEKKIAELVGVTEKILG